MDFIKVGLDLRGKRTRLIDLDTGEILTQTLEETLGWLFVHDGEYVLRSI